MSQVTNVMLTGIYSRPLAENLNDWLEAREYGSLAEVSDSAGGTKALETFVWLGAFNYFDTQAFVNEYRKLLPAIRRGAESVQLFIQGDLDDKFWSVL